MYIFPTAPPKTNITVDNPNGEPPNPFTFKFSEVEETAVPGGSVKVVDTRTFPISKTISGALVTVQPGGIRELHVSRMENDVYDYSNYLVVAPDSTGMELLPVSILLPPQ